MRVCLFRHSPVLQMQLLVSLPPDYTLNRETADPTHVVLSPIVRLTSENDRLELVFMPSRTAPERTVR
jgi:hypothetical protein